METQGKENYGEEEQHTRHKPRRQKREGKNFSSLLQSNNTRTNFQKTPTQKSYTRVERKSQASCKTKKIKSSEASKNSIVYSIPCQTWDIEYIGETHRGLHVRVKEHLRDFRNMNEANSLVQHAVQTGHRPNFTAAKSLQSALTHTKRKAIESAFISVRNTCNQKPGNYRLSRHILCSIITQAAQRNHTRDQRI